MRLDLSHEYFVLSCWQDECVDILHQTIHLTVTKEVVQIKFAVSLFYAGSLKIPKAVYTTFWE